MKLSLSSLRALPLGVEITAERVAVAAAELAGEGIVPGATAVESVCDTSDDALDETLVAALRAAIERIRPATRRCVLSAPWTEALSRVFKLPPGMRRSEAARAADLEADVVAPWPSSERIVALDAIPGAKRELLLSIGRASTLERLVSIVRAARLEPVAIDTPACAWRRLAPHADAVLDASTARAALVVFTGHVPAFQVFAPRLIDERLAAQARLGLIEARRDSALDLQRLVVFATPERYDVLAPLLSGEGYAVEPVRAGGVEGPEWAIAFALATWGAKGRVAA
jgi:hypothetical protein